MDLCLAVVVAGNDCETFWDKDQLTDSCYQFNFQSTLSWREAWASCEQQGADLLSITEIHEQTYINGERQAGPGPGWLAGLRRPWGRGCQEPETCSPSLEDPEPFLLVGVRMALVGAKSGNAEHGRPPSCCRHLAVRAPHGLQLHTVDWPERPGHQWRLAVVGQLTPQVPQLGER